MYTLSALLLLNSALAVHGYGWVAGQTGVDSSFLKESRHATEKRDTSCPFNPVHTGAAPYSDKYPYTGARMGLPGTGKGGIKVPADGDTAHAFMPPGPNDIRGPCPGLNALANHNFLSHDGVTTITELVDAQQNVYNAGYDIAVVLAVLGVLEDGDIVTGKLSIGCDATSRTAILPVLGIQPGLNGHQKFEADSSLTRNDYFTGNGDNYSFNGTLFAEMKAVADRVSGGKFDRNAMAAYRSQRYEESVQQNPNFYFGPFSLLLFGAASFVYELFPSYGSEGVADLATTTSFFGAVPDPLAPGGWRSGPEKIPANWFNRRTPYTAVLTVTEILALYTQYPKLFGGNVGINNFDVLPTPFGIIADGKLPTTATAADLLCLLYELATQPVPSSLSTTTTIGFTALVWTVGKLNPLFTNLGCLLKPDQTLPGPP